MLAALLVTGHWSSPVAGLLNCRFLGRWLLSWALAADERWPMAGEAACQGWAVQTGAPLRAGPGVQLITI